MHFWAPVSMALLPLGGSKLSLLPRLGGTLSYQVGCNSHAAAFLSPLTCLATFDDFKSMCLIPWGGGMKQNQVKQLTVGLSM